jgi:hypothetical protein
MIRDLTNERDGYFDPTGFPNPFRCRLNSVPLQHVSYGAACHCVPQIGQCALDAAIAPIPVLFGQLNDQGLNLPISARATRPAFAGAVVFLRDQFPMPGQQGLRRNNCGHFRQELSAYSFALGGQPATLVVVEPQPPSAELLAKHSVFFAQIFDSLPLALVHPTGHSDQNKLQWIKDSGHPNPLSPAWACRGEPA